MEFIIISGMSGAGKSSAAAFLEDLGFYCVDNMPVALITNFAGLCMAGAGTGKYSRVALVTDIRGGQTFDELFQALDGLREMHLDYQLLFLEAADEDIIRRYKETRHTHPLTRQGYPLPTAVKMERMALDPVRRRADHILNSTGLNLSKFRGELLRLFDMEDVGEQQAGNLPYGQQRKLEILRALASEPKLLLLDEPAAGMNPTETKELMEVIRGIRDRFGVAILLIEHDMSLVMEVCERLYVLDYGTLIATGTPDEVRKDERVIKAYLGG